MVWSCMSVKGFGEAILITENMDARIYVEVLEKGVAASAEYLFGGRNFVFMQDNDPKHRSGLAKEWFRSHGIQVMKWPANSPDMNPIEHAWKRLKERTRALGDTKSKAQLWETVQTALHDLWYKEDKEYFKTLVHSMPNRVKALYEQRGGYTAY